MTLRYHDMLGLPRRHRPDPPSPPEPVLLPASDVFPPHRLAAAGTVFYNITEYWAWQTSPADLARMTPEYRAKAYPIAARNYTDPFWELPASDDWERASTVMRGLGDTNGRALRRLFDNVNAGKHGVFAMAKLVESRPGDFGVSFVTRRLTMPAPAWGGSGASG